MRDPKSSGRKRNILAAVVSILHVSSRVSAGHSRAKSITDLEKKFRLAANGVYIFQVKHTPLNLFIAYRSLNVSRVIASSDEL